jgi:hypothetical protein
VTAFWCAAFSSEEAIKVQNILREHGDDIFQERANISRLGSFGTKMINLIFGCSQNEEGDKNVDKK